MQWTFKCGLNTHGGMKGLASSWKWKSQDLQLSQQQNLKEFPKYIYKQLQVTLYLQEKISVATKQKETDARL